MQPVRRRRGSAETHLGVAEQVVVDKLCDAHLARARVGVRDADRLDAVLDLDAHGDEDRAREEVRVRKQDVLERAEVARARRLCEAPFRRAAPDAAGLGLPDLDPELLGREGVAEERLGDGVRERDRGEALGVGGGWGPEALDRGEGLVVVRRDVEGVGPVGAVEVGAVEEADGALGRLRAGERAGQPWESSARSDMSCESTECS